MPPTKETDMSDAELVFRRGATCLPEPLIDEESHQLLQEWLLTPFATFLLSLKANTTGFNEVVEMIDKDVKGSLKSRYGSYRSEVFMCAYSIIRGCRNLVSCFTNPGSKFLGIESEKDAREDRTNDEIASSYFRVKFLSQIEFESLTIVPIDWYIIKGLFLNSTICGSMAKTIVEYATILQPIDIIVKLLNSNLFDAACCQRIVETCGFGTCIGILSLYVFILIYHPLISCLFVYLRLSFYLCYQGQG